MIIKKFQNPALKLDEMADDSEVQVSPERESEIRASQQADLDELWRKRKEYEEQENLNKTETDKYLNLLDQHGLLFVGDEERKAKLQQLGYSETTNPNGDPVLVRSLEPPLKSEDGDFALALAGGLGTKAAAKTFGWLPTIAEEIGAGIVGTAATYGSDYLGSTIDNYLGTNIRPWLTIGGGLAGAFLGGHWGNRSAMKTAKYTIDNGIRGYSDFHPEIQKEILKVPKHNTEPLLNVGWAPAQTMNVRRAGELDTMYYPSRWDVTNEGANPFGVWLQGKYGVPRTDITNPGKGEKAARARQIFEDRPQYVGNVSLKKPMQTIGEVPDRSALSYDAERMGADGIIYNDVYDNGWNNNQVIFSFNKPNLSESSNTAPRIMWMGPTTGKTTYAKNNFNVVDIDPLTKDTRKRVAGELGMDFRDPRVSASPVYQQAVVDDVVKPWLNDPLNNGKTLVASTKHLLDPKYGIKFDNEPFLPDFNTFVARNQARGFRETPEQLRSWYDSILKIKPDIKIDNSYVNDDMFSVGKTIDDTPVQTNYMEAPPSTPIFDPNGYESKIRNWWFFDKNKTINDDITVDDLKEYVNSLIRRDGNNFSISAADIQLRKNFTDFIDDLTQEDTYHKALSVNDIMKEFDLMARKESPIDINNYSHISDYFTYDAYPRLMNSFQRSGIDLTPKEMDDIYQMYSHPFHGVNISIGYTKPGSAGFSRGTNTIRFSNRYSPTWNDVSDSTIVHELHHSLRSRLGQYLRSRGYDINYEPDWLPETLESGDALRNSSIRGQYLPSEIDTMEPLAMSKEFVDDKTPIAEIGAVTAGDARWKLWNKKRKELGRIPSIEETDQYMDGWPETYFYTNAPLLPYGTQIGSAEEAAFKAFERDVYRRANLTNAIRDAKYNKLPWYKKPFVKKPEHLFPSLYREDLQHKKLMGNAWRDAMKYIGGATGAAIGLNGINNQIEKDKQWIQ